MGNAAPKIMLVEPDAELVELLVASLAHRLDAQITCVASAVDCLDTDVIEPHALIISEMELPDASGVTLADRLQAVRHRPIILLADDPDAAKVIEAMRAGVADFFAKPFPVAELLDSVERAIHGYELRQQSRRRQQRLRDLMRRVIRERRDLRRRIDLICRDLVGAHKRLVHRFAEVEQSQAQPQPETPATK